jgi:hypothetical protein
MVITAGAASQAEMTRVARRYNLVNLYGGYSEPVGTYDGIGILDFTRDGQLVELDADQLYESTVHFGFDFGQLRNTNMQVLIGFQYTKIEQLDAFTDGIFEWRMVPVPFINQYDVNFGFNYLFGDLTKSSLAPYLGANCLAGFTVLSANNVESESQLNVALAAGAGLELKLWQDAALRRFVTFVPQTSYQFYGSGDRARHWNVGAGLKYYFR